MACTVFFVKLMDWLVRFLCHLVSIFCCMLITYLIGLTLSSFRGFQASLAANSVAENKEQQHAFDTWQSPLAICCAVFVGVYLTLRANSTSRNRSAKDG